VASDSRNELHGDKWAAAEQFVPLEKLSEPSQRTRSSRPAEDRQQLTTLLIDCEAVPVQHPDAERTGAIRSDISFKPDLADAPSAPSV
jgi:hypothetical protein